MLDKPMPIGIASAIGRTDRGLAVWAAVHGADVPGRWVIVDRRFVAVEGRQLEIARVAYPSIRRWR